MNKVMNALQVDLPSDSEVRVTRQFHAPRELVYKAYTTPELLRKWLLGPPGWAMPVCEMDVREGGKYRWQWKNEANGKQFGFHGEFQQVDAPALLVHSEFFDAGDIGGSMGEGSRVTIAFSEDNGMTTVTSTMDYGSREVRDQVVATGMTDGMETSYRRLDALLNESPDVA